MQTKLETHTLRVLGSSDLEYYWIVGVNDMGMIELSAVSYGENMVDQTIEIAPNEVEVIAAAKEEMAKQEV